MVKDGTSQRGERAHGNKLTEAQVRDIRALLSARLPERTIAKRYGVAQATINDISRSKTWSWLV